MDPDNLFVATDSVEKELTLEEAADVCTYASIKNTVMHEDGAGGGEGECRSEGGSEAEGEGEG